MTKIIPVAETNQLAQMDITMLPEEKRARVEAIMQEINVEDSKFVIQYGVAAQNHIASFADAILDQIRNKDADYIGEVLSDLMTKVKDIDVGGLSNVDGLLSKIPLLGNLVDATHRFITRYEKLSTQIDKIEDELEKSRIQLLKDISILDSLFEKNLGYLDELDMFIIAGSQKIKELNDTVLPALKEKADSSGDILDAQNYNDMATLVSHFDKKLYDLKLSRTISIQSIPQIRLIQGNDRDLVQKIQSSILNTIPLWKNQIVIAISLLRQNKAMEVQREVTHTTNELLKRNSQLLKDNSVDIAKENERGIVDIETLKKVNADLISIIEETLKIQQEGRATRQAAETEIAQIEKELRDKLASLR